MQSLCTERSHDSLFPFSSSVSLLPSLQLYLLLVTTFLAPSMSNAAFKLNNTGQDGEDSSASFTKLQLDKVIKVSVRTCVCVLPPTSTFTSLPFLLPLRSLVNLLGHGKNNSPPPYNYISSNLISILLIFLTS